MKRRLFEEAYSIIDGVPDDRVRLNNWQELLKNSWLPSDQVTSLKLGERPIKTVEEITCGTIACAAGWLALHPAMQARGLYPNSKLGAPCFVKNGVEYEGFDALAKFFGISVAVSEELFGSVRIFEQWGIQSEREVWLARIRKFLKKPKEVDLDNPITA